VEDRTPSNLYTVQAAWANTDLLVERGGQPRLPEVWRLHHMPMAIDDLVGGRAQLFPSLAFQA